MVKKSFWAVVLISFILCLVNSSAWAVPGLINYQGKLTDADGKALSGSYQIGFYLYNAETGGNVLWSEQQTVTITDGIYSVKLGSTGLSPFPVEIFRNNQLYLEMVIRNPKTGSNETLSPRQQLTSTAFAMRAGDVDNGEWIIQPVEIERIVQIEDGLDAHIQDPEAHHKKTISFKELIDTASDAQIPDDISIDYAKKAGDADTIDGKHAGGFLDTSDNIQTKVGGLNIGGNVGIGTTEPKKQLHIKDTSANPAIILEGHANKAPHPSIGFIDELGNRKVQVVGSISSGRLSLDYDGASGGVFFIRKKLNSDQDAVLVIDEIGRVGIDKISPSYKLHVNGAAAGTSWTNLSDSRLKQDIAPIDNALDKVSALNGVTFRWRTDQFPDKGLAEGTKIGLIAQEVEKVLPEVVSTDHEGYKSVEYANIVAVLTEAIKAQQTQIVELKAKNEELQARIEILERR